MVHIMEQEEDHMRLFPNPVPEGRSELLAKLLGTQVSEAVCIINYLHQSLKMPGDNNDAEPTFTAVRSCGSCPARHWSIILQIPPQFVALFSHGPQPVTLRL